MRTRLACPDRNKLREVLDYDPVTGAFTWRKPVGRVQAGQPAGCIDVHGAVKIAVDRTLYAAHYLAWLNVHGEWPKVVKHRNGDKSDNRIANLFSPDADETVDQDRLKTVVNYDPETGVFTWKIATSNRNPVGSPAGTTTNAGYRSMTIDGKRYLAHRLAWLYVYGEWPTSDLDHINLDRTDNRIANLREASRGQNMANGNLRKDNTSGCKGVYWNKQSSKWRVTIQKNGRMIQIGMFASYDDAVRAATKARQEIHGEFAGSEGTPDMNPETSGGPE